MLNPQPQNFLRYLLPGYSRPDSKYRVEKLNVLLVSIALFTIGLPLPIQHR